MNLPLLLVGLIKVVFGGLVAALGIWLAPGSGTSLRQGGPTAL
jgi:hypothetical protein